jgi:hypothetical protein
VSYRPPKGQPKTARHLGQLVAQYAEAAGVGVRRVRLRVSAMAFVGALEALIDLIDAADLPHGD